MMPEAVERFKSSVYEIHPQLNEEAWNYLSSILRFRELGRKEFFYEEGSIQPTIGFLHQGLMRAYYINESGEEVTIRFIREGGYATDYSAFINREPSRYYFQCLEPCEIIEFSLDDMREGYDRHQGLDRFGRLIAERILTYQQDRILDFQFLSAEERYMKFIRDYPDLFNRVSLSHLSSYLGIQRPSLSRIRKNLTQK